MFAIHALPQPGNIPEAEVLFPSSPTTGSYLSTTGLNTLAVCVHHFDMFFTSVRA